MSIAVGVSAASINLQIKIESEKLEHITNS